MAEQRTLTDGQRAYETKRAAKAGVSLEKWLEQKRRNEALAVERARAAAPKPAPKKPGLLARLMERAHKPL